MKIKILNLFILTLFLILVPVSLNLNPEKKVRENVNDSIQLSYIEFNVAHATLLDTVKSIVSAIVNAVKSLLTGGGGGGGGGGGDLPGYDASAWDAWAGEGACATCNVAYNGPIKGDVGVPAGVVYRDQNNNGRLDAGDLVQGSSGGNGGGGGGTIIRPSTPASPPSVALMVRSEAGEWTGNDITIYEGEDIDLRWNSLRASECTGTNFVVPLTGHTFSGVPTGAVNGIQNDVTGPRAGTSIIYTITCTGSSGSGGGVGSSYSGTSGGATGGSSGGSYSGTSGGTVSGPSGSSQSGTSGSYSGGSTSLSSSDSLTVTARAGHRPQCSDDVDNTDPEDTLIDWDGGGIALPTTYDFKTKHPESSYTPYFDGNWRFEGGRNIINTIRSMSSQIPGNYFFYDQTTANKICAIAGYNKATLNASSQYKSPETYNLYTKWTGSNWTTIAAKPKSNGYFIKGLTCSQPTSIGTPDPGCTGPTDDDETDGAPTVTLSVRNGDSSWTGNNISIVAGDNINLRWESSNATQCTATAFSIGATTNVNGTQTTVTEPAAGASTLYSITCTGTSGPDATDSLTVTTLAAGRPPTIDASPLIVRSGEESTITWDVGTADPAECSITGFGNTLHTLPDSTGGMTIPIIGETKFTITCPLGSDSVTIKVLPVIQET